MQARLKLAWAVWYDHQDSEHTHPYICIYIRGVTVHKHHGSVRTSVLTSRFGTVSVQQEEKH